MASDDKITHSFIREHTRQVAIHDKSKSTRNRKRDWHAVSSEMRLKEFNRSRQMLLADAFRLRRMVKARPKDPKE